MHILDLTLDSPAENLALDEALLDWAESEADEARPGDEDPPRSACRTVEVLRLWEPQAPFVVVGRGSQLEREVDLAACERLDVPVLRRASGGGAVVVGPGCLMYAVVLSYELRPDLRPLDAAHGFVLARVAEATRACVPEVAPAGTSDLIMARHAATGHSATVERVLDGGDRPVSGSNRVDLSRDATTDREHRKFSGNSLRCKRTHFLYHGTLMYDFAINLIESCLRMPPREPDYRQGRSHADFLANLPVSGAELRRELAGAWRATQPLTRWPRQQTAVLAETRYSRDEWTWSR